jgi:hypothetical protein
MYHPPWYNSHLSYTGNNIVGTPVFFSYKFDIEHGLRALPVHLPMTRQRGPQGVIFSYPRSVPVFRGTVCPISTLFNFVQVQYRTGSRITGMSLFTCRRLLIHVYRYNNRDIDIE